MKKDVFLYSKDPEYNTSEVQFELFFKEIVPKFNERFLIGKIEAGTNLVVDEIFLYKDPLLGGIFVVFASIKNSEHKNKKVEIRRLFHQDFNHLPMNLKLNLDLLEYVEEDEEKLTFFQQVWRFLTEDHRRKDLY